MKRSIHPMHGLLAAGVLAIALSMPVLGADDATSPTNEPAIKLSESNPGSEPTPYKGWSVEPQVAVGYYGVRVVKGW